MLISRASIGTQHTMPSLSMADVGSRTGTMEKQPKKFKRKAKGEKAAEPEKDAAPEGKKRPPIYKSR